MIDKELWSKYFAALPNWICPTCQKGTLRLSKNGLISKETGRSAKGHGDPNWDPDWVSERFSAFLMCDNSHCEELVIVAGSASVDLVYDYDDDGRPFSDYVNYFKPTSITPAPCAFPVREEYPQELQIVLREAFSLFWMDERACANRARSSIELFLDDLQIPASKYLDDRLKALGKIDAEAGQLLKAVKWIGNAGSHNPKVGAANQKQTMRAAILDVFNILEHVFDAHYLNHKAELLKIAGKINNKKGI